MKNLITLLVLVVATTATADIFLVKVGPTTWEQITALDQLGVGMTPVVRVADGITLPPGDGGDNGGPIGNIAQKIQTITEETITTELEARALLSVVRLLKNPTVDMAKFKEGLTVAITQLSQSNLLPNNKFDQWLARVQPLSAGLTPDQFQKLLNTGVTEGTKTLQVTKSADLIVAASSGDLIAEAAAERLDLGSLLQLIQLIFELLKNLGILGA